MFNAMECVRASGALQVNYLCAQQAVLQAGSPPQSEDETLLETPEIGLLI